MVDGGGTNTSKKYKNWFAMTDWAGGKVSEADQKKFLAYSIDSLAKFLGHVRKRDDRDTYSKSSSKLPFINPQTGQLHWYIPHFGDRSEVSESEEYFFNTDAVRFLAWLDSISNDKSPFQNDSDVEKLINQVFPSREPEYPFTDTALYETIGETLSLQSRVQANVVNLIKAKPLEEVKKEGEEVDKTGEAGQIARKVTTAGVPVGGGPAGEPAEGGGETGSASETGIQPPSATQPQPTDANRQPLVTDAERERRRMYGYESAWLTNTIITDLCRQYGIAETPALMASLHDVVYDSIGNMSQEELRGLFANTSGRLNQLKAIQLKLGSNVQFVQELNQLYDANYIALARIDETKAKAFREKTGYIPSKRAVEAVEFASEEALKKQLENPVDTAVNQAINQLTGHDPLSAEQLQSLELVLTQLATGLGDKTLAAELSIPINSNQLDIKEYIQSLDDLAIYRLIYGTKAKPDKAVLLKLRANLDQVKQNITSTCQTIIAEKSIEFHADGFAKGASSHVSEVSRTGDLRESPLGDVANRLMPVMSGSLFAPEAVALVQSENRLSEASNDYKQFVKQFATTFNALDEDTQKMLILEAGVDPATVIGSDGKYIFDEQFMRAAGKLSKILRNANKAREIKRKVDERLAQSHALSKSEIDALAKMSGELKRLGLHAEADQLQNDLKKSFKDQLGTKQLMVYEHLEQLTIAERALNEAEFQVRMARTHANTHQALIQANQPATDTVSAYLTARSAAFAAGAAADQALKKIVDLPPDQKEIANELAEKRFRVEKQLSNLKSELGGIKTARDLSQNLSDEDYKKVFQEFANNPYYTDSRGNQREMWLPVSDEVFSGEYQEPSPIEPMGEAGSYDVQPAEFGWGMPASDFDLDYNDFVGGDEYADGGEDLVDQYNQTVEGAKRGGGKSNTRRLAGHIQKKVQAKRAAKKVAEQAAKKAVEGAAEAGSTVAGAASGPAGWAIKGALMAAKVANMLRTKEGRKKLGMYVASATGAGISFYLALKGAMGAAAGGLAGAAAGGATGAIIGSFFGPLGTLIGAGIGGSLGAMGGYANGGGSIFGLGGGATTALPATPAYYSPSAPTFTPAASTTTLAPSQTMAGSGAGSPGLVDPAATAGTKTASMSQQAINDASARLSGQSPTSQLSAQPGGQWVDPSTGYRFDPNTGQVYDSAGKLVDPTGSTITPGATAAGATAGAVGIAAVIGPLGLSGAAFFMPAISVLSVMFITLITIITIFAAFLTPMPSKYAPGEATNRSKYATVDKVAEPDTLPNNPRNEEVTYTVKITANPTYRIQVTEIKDSFYYLPPNQPKPTITVVEPPPTSVALATNSPSQEYEFTYKVSMTGGVDVGVFNRVELTYQVTDPNGNEIGGQAQKSIAYALVKIGNPKLGCFNFDIDGGQSYNVGYATLTSVPMTQSDVNAILFAFLKRAGASPEFIEHVCKISPSNPDGTPIDIFKFPRHNAGYWGWVNSANTMVLYAPFFASTTSALSQEYTFIHELGHIVDYRNARLRTNFKAIWDLSGNSLYSYPFAGQLTTYDQKIEEAFAEAIAIHVTGAANYTDYSPNGYPMKINFPTVYNHISENIFGGLEMFYAGQ